MTSPSRARREERPAGGARRGLTLLELLLVMTIFAVVLGSGVGFFANLDLSRNQAPGLVKNVLRAARLSALSRRAPARVVIDPASRTLRVEALRVVGTWHFEGQRATGVPDVEPVVQDTRFDQAGWIGAALAFDGRPGAFATFPVQDDPAFDPEQGFAIECAVRRDGGGAGRLLRLGDAVEVLVNGKGSVRARFRAVARPAPAAGPDGEGLGSGGSVLVETGDGALPADRWARLRVGYDRARFTIAVDGIPVAEAPADVPVAPIEDDLVLSDPKHPFPGAIDALVISMVEAQDPVRLPERVSFGAAAPLLIHFDEAGGLDRRYHAEPVVVPLDFADGARVQISVGLFGTVEG